MHVKETTMFFRFTLALLILAATCVATPASAAPSNLSGLWVASVDIQATTVPFTFGIAQKGEKVEGWFFNGDAKIISTGGRLDKNHLVLDFGQYARRLDVTVGSDGALDGVYGSNPPSTETPAPANRQPFPFHAKRAPAKVAADANPPQIGGVWILPAHSRKHDETAWRFIVKQTGAHVAAAILRIDGDTGSLNGDWHDGKLQLSNFTGSGGIVLDVAPTGDGALNLVLHSPYAGDEPLAAYRQDDARATSLVAADPMTHTGVKDPNAVFAFSFPDIDGHLVSNTDPRFKGKVIVLDVSGSWCPNCHDEAPFLQEMYRKYKDRGLEVVTLDFEEKQQLDGLPRLRAFIKRYGLEYTMLVCGTPPEAPAKIPQAQGLDSWPTTFFIGRDGKVKAAHTGFAAPASGPFHDKLAADFTSQIETLLAQKE